MKTLTLTQFDDIWVKLDKKDSNFIKFVCLSVRPKTYRHYEVSENAWLVSYKKLPELISVGKRFFDHIDYSSLPAPWQMLIAGAVLEANQEPVDESPYSLLFLTEQAPDEVIKASYKALSKMYHPDSGGDANKMVELNLAYEKILNLKK